VPFWVLGLKWPTGGYFGLLLPRHPSSPRPRVAPVSNLTHQPGVKAPNLVLSTCVHPRGPPRQQGHDSTAACASTERHHAGQSATARRRALLQSATTPTRAQQHGGVRFCRAPPRQPERNSTAACASAERHRACQSATGSTAAC
jgi:hypothetical protein